MKVLLVTEEESANGYARWLTGALKGLGASVYLSSDIGLPPDEASVVCDTPRLSAFGLLEVVGTAGSHAAKLRQLLAFIRNHPLDRVVLIDYGGFNLLLASLIHKRLKPDWFIPPKVWAWGGFRASLIAHRTRRILTILPFEPPLFLRHGGDARYVGHPLVEMLEPWQQVEKDEELVCLMPGSRPQELAFSLEPLLEAARLLRAERPELRPVLLLAAGVERPPIEAACRSAGIETAEGDARYRLLAAARGVLAASGTAVLEAALLGCPAVAVYSLSPLSLALARKLLYTRFITLPNIVLGTNAIPEIIGEHIAAERVVDAARRILDEGPGRHWCLHQLSLLHERLAAGGSAIDRAAGLIVEAGCAA